MPIRPENRRFYNTPQFAELRALLRARAGDRCEHCRAPNGQRVFFTLTDEAATAKPRASLWYDEDAQCWITSSGQILDRDKILAARSVLMYPPGPSVLGKYINVVLTAAHLDHDPRHQDPERCAYLCQRCHLLHDAKDNYARARRTAAAASGQLWLDDEIKFAARPEAQP